MKKGKVFVGLSGGVDSSVSAALLKNAGYDVTGVFIKVWQPNFLPCSQEIDRLDALRVAAHLRIPFFTLDLEREYKKEVLDLMISGYGRGETPNPDVLCNRAIKFGGFYKFACSLRADFIATGHYAKVGIFGDKPSLLEGADNEKDQSYFLWMLNEEDLKHSLFPVGDMNKNEVRAFAKKFGLPTADRKDSQGLCFMGELDMKEFLSHFLPKKSGRVQNEKGDVIGTHEGAHFYTIGERHGFETLKKTNKEEPLYVISKNIKENIITASPRKLLEKGKTRFRLENINFINGEPDFLKKYTARIRYRQNLFEVSIKKVEGKIIIETASPQYVDVGQSAVIYDNERVVGGGIVSA